MVMNWKWSKWRGGEGRNLFHFGTGVAKLSIPTITVTASSGSLTPQTIGRVLVRDF
jgi:hypothetical protein